MSVDKIENILHSLDTHKAISHDKLPTIILKECAGSLAPSITAIINFSLSHGFQLSDWKRGNVSPIFKKGKKDIGDNYRPVSLLPVISKVQECCMALRLVPHVKELLYPFQHGFQKGRSCVMQLLEAFYDISGFWNRGRTWPPRCSMLSVVFYFLIIAAFERWEDHLRIVGTICCSIHQEFATFSLDFMVHLLLRLA